MPLDFRMSRGVPGCRHYGHCGRQYGYAAAAGDATDVCDVTRHPAK